jgi:hypothetical protein
MRLAPKITNTSFPYRNASPLAALITLLLFTTAATAQDPPLPTIGTIVAPQTITEGVSANIFIRDVATEGRIVLVEMDITRPDGSTAVNNVLGGVSPGAYEVDYHGFFYPGTYTVSVIVSASVSTGEGNVIVKSEPAITTVTQTATEFQNDTFEPDNTAADATWFGINVGLHSHTFSSATDEDWLLIYAEDFKAGQAFDQKPHNNEVEIETRNKLRTLDTKIEVYKVDPLDPENTLEFVIESDDTSSRLIFYVHLERNEAEQAALDGSGFFAIRIVNMSPEIYGEDSRYDVRIWREQGAILAGGIAGIVTNKLNSQPVAKANVGIPGFGGIEAITTDDGIYVFPAMVPSFEYSLEAWNDSYKRSEPVTVTVRGGEFVVANFELDPDEVQVPPEPTLQELADALLDNLSTFDSTADGSLSLEEAQVAIPTMTDIQFTELDTDLNGALSAEELDAIANPKAAGCHAGNRSAIGSSSKSDFLLVAIMLALLILSGRALKTE